jgi:hypothetical protein
MFKMFVLALEQARMVGAGAPAHHEGETRVNIDDLGYK